MIIHDLFSLNRNKELIDAKYPLLIDRSGLSA
jgi:hypothetical protein